MWLWAGFSSWQVVGLRTSAPSMGLAKGELQTLQLCFIKSREASEQEGGTNDVQRFYMGLLVILLSFFDISFQLFDFFSLRCYCFSCILNASLLSALCYKYKYFLSLACPYILLRMSFDQQNSDEVWFSHVVFFYGFCYLCPF